jgi:UDP-galactopyranose mutase
VGRDIYEKLVKGYTEKQWGRDCKELPAFIIKRLPVRLTFDNNYFNALYQGIPIGGYTRLVANMLGIDAETAGNAPVATGENTAGNKVDSSVNDSALKGLIDIRLGIDYLKNKAELDGLADKVVYTGAIDEYYGYKLGALEYRSVRFENELLDMPNFQGNAAVNYTDRETPWTRIIEHKWFEFGKDENGNDLPKTIISREYSSEWKLGDEPYYPVNDEKNGQLYQEYKKLAEADDKVIFGGRLGEYKYYDMDAVIAAALKKCGELL